MPNKPMNFDGEKFVKKYNLTPFDFYDDGKGNIICPSLPNLTDADLLDCVVDVWHIVRVRRDELLKACDWTQLPDAALLPEEKAAWAEYRQALRDLPQTYDNPEDVVFPSPPGGV